MTAPPREPTQDMCIAGANAWARPFATFGDVWKAMYDAAPAPSADKPKRKRCEHDRWPGDDCDICPAPPAAQPAEPTMDDAIAAGDGTLHGAIDYWQGVAQRQAREIADYKEKWFQSNRDLRAAWNRAERAEAELHKANIDSANLLAGCSDLSVDVEKYRQEIAALRLAVKDDAQWAQENERLTRELDRVKVQLTSEITAALAERDALRECVKAADAMRRGEDCPMCDSGKLRNPAKLHWDSCAFANYDAARAKVGK